jgi:hypothetical protein
LKASLPDGHLTLVTCNLENPRVSLHGGVKGFDFAVWERISNPTLFSEKEVSNLPASGNATSYAFFKHVSPDGDEGYPGTLTVEALVAVVQPPEQEKTYQKPGEPAQDGEFSLGTVVYIYRAKVDKGVTPINLTNVSMLPLMCLVPHLPRIFTPPQRSRSTGVSTSTEVSKHLES